MSNAHNTAKTIHVGHEHHSSQAVMLDILYLGYHVCRISGSRVLCKCLNLLLFSLNFAMKMGNGDSDLLKHEQTHLKIQYIKQKQFVQF